MKPNHSCDYIRYIHSAKWRKHSEVFRIRARGFCERCKKQSVRLEVHHKYYERLGRELPTDCEVLCQECHPKADKERVVETRVRNENAAYYGWLEARYGSEAWRADDYDSLRRYEDWSRWH